MATFFPPSLIGAAIEEFMNESSIQNYNNMETVGYARKFDPKLLFLGKNDGPSKLCQNLLETALIILFFVQADRRSVSQV